MVLITFIVTLAGVWITLTGFTLEYVYKIIDEIEKKTNAKLPVRMLIACVVLALASVIVSLMAGVYVLWRYISHEPHDDQFFRMAVFACVAFAIIVFYIAIMG